MISMQLDESLNACGGSPAACMPLTRRRPALALAPADDSAKPSIATRSKGGWSRSAYTFSRSTAPAACVSGSDSIGRHARCCSISVSACAGVSSDMVVRKPRRSRRDRARPSSSGGLLFRLVLRLPGAQLFIEASRDVGDFLDRVVVFRVVLIFLLLCRIGLLVRRGVGRGGD